MNLISWVLGKSRHLQVQGEVQSIWIMDKRAHKEQRGRLSTKRASSDGLSFNLPRRRTRLLLSFVHLSHSGFRLCDYDFEKKNKQARAGHHLVWHDEHDYCSAFFTLLIAAGFRLCVKHKVDEQIWCVCETERENLQWTACTHNIPSIKIDYRQLCCEMCNLRTTLMWREHESRFDVCVTEWERIFDGRHVHIIFRQ